MPEFSYPLERLRALANLLRCMLHTAVPYMVVRTGMWPLKEHNDSNLLPDVLVFIAHGFIMELFYVIAGFLAFRQVLKLGRISFFKNRIRRIIVPFVVGMAVLVPYVLFLFPIGKGLESGRFIVQWQVWGREAWSLWSENLFPVGHLWFLYYLICYYAFTLLYFQYHRRMEAVLGRPASVYFGLMFAVAVICLAGSKAWYILNPLTTRVEASSFFYFLVFFCFGMIAFRRPELFEYARMRRRLFLAIFLATSLTAPVFQKFAPETHLAAYQTIHWGAILSTALQSVSGVWAALGWAQQFREAPPAWISIAARSSYWVYLVHLPTVMTIHLLLFPLDLPLVIKYIIALGLSLSLVLGAWKLFGKRWL